MAEVFAEVLKTEPPGIHDDFFELGGHSLAAMQVLARLQQIFQTTLPIDSLFAAPTVAGLSERIGEQMANLVADGSARLEQKLPSKSRAGDGRCAYSPPARRDAGAALARRNSVSIFSISLAPAPLTTCRRPYG